MYNLKVSRIIWTPLARKLYKQMGKIFPNFTKQLFDTQTEKEKDFFRALAQQSFFIKLSKRKDK